MLCLHRTVNSYECLSIFLQEVLSSFSSKLDVKLMEHFSLVLTGPKKGQISYIQNNEKIAEVIIVCL